MRALDAQGNQLMLPHVMRSPQQHRGLHDSSDNHSQQASSSIDYDRFKKQRASEGSGGMRAAFHPNESAQRD
jgi:hypothetical protein